MKLFLSYLCIYFNLFLTFIWRPFQMWHRGDVAFSNVGLLRSRSVLWRSYGTMWIDSCCRSVFCVFLLFLRFFSKFSNFSPFSRFSVTIKLIYLFKSFFSEYTFCAILLSHTRQFKIKHNLWTKNSGSGQNVLTCWETPFREKDFQRSLSAENLWFLWIECNNWHYVNHFVYYFISLFSAFEFICCGHHG